MTTARAQPVLKRQRHRGISRSGGNCTRDGRDGDISGASEFSASVMETEEHRQHEAVGRAGMRRPAVAG